MSFSDEHMDRAIRRMEKQLRTVYAAAWTDAQELLDGFMKTWAAREKKIVDDLENDRIQLPPNETKESYLRKWRLNHIGMSQRWAAIRQGIVDRMTDANRIAVEQINGITPSVMAANHNYTAYQIEKDIPNIMIGNGPKMGVSFNLVNEHAVANLQSGTKTLLPKRKLDVPKDKMWNNRKIQNEILSGILTGKSVDKIAKDLQRITDMNAAASMRNARTALGAAQCAGQQMAMDEAADMGIEILKEWRATLDDRTRDSHQNLDGVRVGKDETFPNGCFYPCDPNGPAKEVYNCRCVLKTIIPGVNDDRGTRIGRGEDGKWTRFDNTTYRGVDDTQSYAAWMQEKINGTRNYKEAFMINEETVNEGIAVHNWFGETDNNDYSFDFSSAVKFANGDIGIALRLRDDDPHVIMSAVDEVLSTERYGFRDSRWNGELNIVSRNEMRSRFFGADIWGIKENECPITIRDDKTDSVHVFIHEDLHSRSISAYLNDKRDNVNEIRKIYFANKNIEEGSVEYMTRMICDDCNIPYSRSCYNIHANAIEDIRRIISPETKGIDFAKELFDIELIERYNYIKGKTEKYIVGISGNMDRSKYRLIGRLREDLNVLE